MNPTESLALTRFVRAACPQQKFDEYTPDAWHELLSDLNLTDCREAVSALGRRQTFISPAEIRGEVRRIRADRLRAVPSSALEPADVDPNDIEAYQRARLALVQHIADGQQLPEPAQLPKRPVAELVASTTARLPRIPRSAS